MWEAPRHNRKAAGIKPAAFKLAYRVSHCILQKRDVRFPLNEIKTLQKRLLFLLVLQPKLIQQQGLRLLLGKVNLLQDFQCNL